MIVLFWMASIWLVSEAFFRRRCFDIFSVAAAGSLIYFLPGFFGWVGHDGHRAGVPVREILPETYLVWIVVLLAQVFALRSFDRELARGRLRPPKFLGSVSNLSALNQWIPYALAAMGVVLTFLDGGAALNSRNKVDVMEVIGRGHILWYAGAVVGAGFSAYRRSRLGLLAFVLLAGLHAFVGFRLGIGTGIAVILAVHLGDGRRLSLVREHKFTALLALIGLVGLFLWKPIYPFLKSGDIDGLMRRFDSAEAFLQPLLRAEPFATQSVMNEVVAVRFDSSGEQFLELVKKVRVVPAELLPEFRSFNQQFQPELFPWAHGGLSGNPWSESYALLGWPGILIFLGLFLVAVRSLSRMFLLGAPGVRVLASVLGVFWCVYFHRNQMVVEVNLLVRLVGVWTVAMLPQLVQMVRTTRRRRGRVNRLDPGLAHSTNGLRRSHSIQFPRG